MPRLAARLFDVSGYTRLADRDRAVMIDTIMVLLLVLYTLYATFVANPSGQNLWQRAAVEPEWALFLVGFYGFAVFTYWANRSRRLALAAVGPVAMWYFGAVMDSTISNHYSGVIDASALIGLVLLAGLLMRERGLLMIIPIALATLALGFALRATDPTPPPAQTSLFEFIIFGLQLVGLAGIVYLFLRTTRISRRQGIEEASRELRLARITTEIAGRISRRMALTELLTNAVEQICVSYPDIYHAQIFLIDDTRQSARLVASTGEIGRLLIERQHNLAVGSLSVIGQVTATNRVIIARAGSPDSIHRRNEFLPDTAVETAFPLRIGATIIGALDVQSKTPTHFDETDISVFQSLADSIAVAIDNARLFEETTERLQENQRLVEQSRRALEQVERLNQQLTGQFWSDYLGSHGQRFAWEMDFDHQRGEAGTDWTPTLAEAARENHLVQAQRAESQVIAVPLRVRGQVIGAMEFELDREDALLPEDLTLIEEVGERLGLAAENSRLFEASQRVAQREALVNEIATRLQASSSVEMTLNAAARSLKETLRAGRVAIRLGTPTVTNGVQEEKS